MEWFHILLSLAQDEDGSTKGLGGLTSRERTLAHHFRRLGGPQNPSGLFEGNNLTATETRATDRPARSLVTIPTEISRIPHCLHYVGQIPDLLLHHNLINSLINSWKWQSEIIVSLFYNPNKGVVGPPLPPKLLIS